MLRRQKFGVLRVIFLPPRAASCPRPRPSPRHFHAKADISARPGLDAGAGGRTLARRPLRSPRRLPAVLAAVRSGPCGSSGVPWHPSARKQDRPDLRGCRESPGTSAPHGKVRTVGVPEQRCTGAPADPGGWVGRCRAPAGCSGGRPPGDGASRRQAFMRQGFLGQGVHGQGVHGTELSGDGGFRMGPTDVASARRGRGTGRCT